MGERNSRIRLIIAGAALTAIVFPLGAALADPPDWAPAHGWRRHHERRDDDYRPRHHRAPRIIDEDTRIYRGDDGRLYCRRSDGTTGLIVGAAVGGLIGNRLARGHSATLGTLLGAGAGALLGQAIDKGSVHCE